MRKLDLAALLRKTVLRLNRIHADIGSSVQLSLPLNLSELFWRDCNLEKLIKSLIHCASVASHPATPVRISVRQKAKMPDLEKFFDIYPSRWIQLRIELAAAGFEEHAREILRNHGYQCEGWVGVEDSRQQLGAFHIGTQSKVKLLFWTENRRFRHKCDLLIPVTESISSS